MTVKYIKIILSMIFENIREPKASLRFGFLLHALRRLLLEETWVHKENIKQNIALSNQSEK